MVIADPESRQVVIKVVVGNAQHLCTDGRRGVRVVVSWPDFDAIGAGSILEEGAATRGFAIFLPCFWPLTRREVSIMGKSPGSVFLQTRVVILFEKDCHHFGVVIRRSNPGSCDALRVKRLSVFPKSATSDRFFFAIDTKARRAFVSMAIFFCDRTSHALKNPTNVCQNGSNSRP